MIKVRNLDDYSQEDFCACGVKRVHSSRSHALLVLERYGEAHIEIRQYIGGDGIPIDEWRGSKLVWAIPDGIDRNSLAHFLAREGAIFLREIHAGHDVLWNGIYMTGTLTTEAAELSCELRDKIFNLPHSEMTAITMYEWTHLLSVEQLTEAIDEWLPGWREGRCDYARGVRLAEAEARQYCTVLVDTEAALREFVRIARGDK